MSLSRYSKIKIKKKNSMKTRSHLTPKPEKIFSSWFSSMFRKKVLSLLVPYILHAFLYYVPFLFTLLLAGMYLFKLLFMKISERQTLLIFECLKIFLFYSHLG